MTDSPGTLLVASADAAGEPYVRRLGQALLATAIALPTMVVVVTVVPVLVFSLAGPMRSSPGSVMDDIGGVLFIIVFALLYGSIPAVFVGAPAYAWALWRGRASGGLAAAIGAAPGFALLVLGQDYQLFGWLVLAYGIPTALLTHVVARRVGAGHR